MRSLVLGMTAALCLSQARAGDLPVERLFDAPDLQGPSLRQMRFSPGRQARQLPARPRRCAGGVRPVGLGRVAQDASPAGRFTRARPRRGKAFRRGGSPARAPAHRGAARHRRLPVVARLARAARPALGRSLLLRPVEARGRGRAAADRDRGLRDRPEVLAARPLRQLRPRPGPLRGRGRDRRRAPAHDGRRRAREPWRRRVHRAGGDGPRHRLLVVAGREAPRLHARRRVAGRRGRALRDRRRRRARPASNAIPRPGDRMPT